ncbi:uncharacterized protein [Blastocystis hominis]|uniref:Ribosomal protein L31e n=1 Tax=Blastocystis hominis TaxID=12968 RepID=D8M4B4_BLAHO|nr:uncharacterized protein [Blastocystis hominis]CBK22903.2 unnamed protein product [Blastocystis hominis]|eukprot:XP_012896951.1 uncharacterized protein [Blastocystis hominis]
MNTEKKELTPVTREYTIRLSKISHKICYKRRAPRCMAMIRKFAQTAMCTEDVRIDPTVNKYVWNKGIHAVPARIRVRMSRISQDGEDGSKHFYTVVEVVNVPHFHQLQTTVTSA